MSHFSLGWRTARVQPGSCQLLCAVGAPITISHGDSQHCEQLLGSIFLKCRHCRRCLDVGAVQGSAAWAREKGECGGPTGAPAPFYLKSAGERIDVSAAHPLGSNGVCQLGQS